MAKLNLLLVSYLTPQHFLGTATNGFQTWFHDVRKACKNIAPQQIELLYKVRQRNTCVGFYLFMDSAAGDA